MNSSGSSDRSWNDPPVVKYEIVGPAKTHHLLKKRISQNSQVEEVTKTNSRELSDTDSENFVSKDMPSVVNKNNSVAAKNLEESKSTLLLEESESNLLLSDEGRLSFVIKVLQAILNETSDKCEKTTKDVDKRIDIMKDSWNSKLSIEVKNKMVLLAQELKVGNIDAALKIQWSLMMENVKEVKSWMVGVKHVIEMKKEIIAAEKNQNPDSSL